MSSASAVTLTLSIDEANLLFHVFADETCEQREMDAPDLAKYEALEARLMGAIPDSALGDDDPFKRALSDKCPYCGSDETEGHSVDTGKGEAFQGMSCRDCDKTWTDRYTLAEVIGHE